MSYRDDPTIEVNEDTKSIDENLEKIHWAPTINTIIPDKFECLQESDEILTPEQELFIDDIRELIDETRIAALCCELVLFVTFSIRLNISIFNLEFF